MFKTLEQSFFETLDEKQKRLFAGLLATVLKRWQNRDREEA
jgi:hypothetical protein